MKISIITPSYNQGRFIRKTIESVLSQDVPELEYMVLDGGSQDESRNIIREYERRLKYWRSFPDGGQSDAIHEGFKASSGEILGWLNSDDLLMQGSLAFVIQTFKNNPNIQFMYGGGQIIDGEGKEKKILREPCYNVNWQIYVRNCIMQPSAFWRRELYFKVGGLDTSLQFAMDYDLWFKICAVTGPHVTRKLLSQQRVYRECKSLFHYIEMQQEMETVRKRYFNLTAPSSRLRSKVFWRLQRIYKKSISGCYFPLSRLGG